MTKKKSPKASLSDVAKAAGISKTAVGYALRNLPSVSKETRERVKQIARQLGYAPDARMVSWMSKVQKAKTNNLLPIAWLNTDPRGEDVWRKFSFLSPYLEGARERCQLLGYRLEEFWTHEPGITERRLSQILYHRGIEGAIITYPAQHIRLQWDHLACVALGGGLLAPRLHRVVSDTTFNLMLAFKKLRRHGCRRIGICVSDHADRMSQRDFRLIAHHFAAVTSPADLIPPLFYPGELGKDLVLTEKLFADWFRRYRPEVIVTANGRMKDWVEASGLRVPEDVAVVHTALDNDVLDWAGIHSKKRALGATAAEWVISMVQNHRFGLPETPLTTLVRGTWQHGTTLQTPKAAKLAA